MREIKFRAWQLNAKEFLDELILADPYRCPVIPMGQAFRLHDTGNVVFQQFTGLKDRNGKEICEGDLIKYGICRDDDDDPICSVVFEDGAFRRVYPNWSNDLQKPALTEADVRLMDIYIVGNIWENAESLVASR